MLDSSTLFIRKSGSLLVEDYLPKIETSVATLTDEDIWWRPNEASNAIGNLLLHLVGNMSQSVLDGVGRQSYVRHRQQEFDERRALPVNELMTRLRDVVEQARVVIGAQTPESLSESRRIQGYDVTVLEAIYHAVEHFGMHTGQIVTLTKLRVGRDLRLWQPPPG